MKRSLVFYIIFFKIYYFKVLSKFVSLQWKSNGRSCHKMMDITIGSLHYSNTETRYCGTNIYPCGGDQSFIGEKRQLFFPTLVRLLQRWSDLSTELGSVPWKNAFMMEATVQVRGWDTGSTSFSSCPHVQNKSTDSSQQVFFLFIRMKRKGNQY